MTSPTSPPTDGGFRLDVEKAEEALIALRGAHAQLVEVRSEAFNVARQPRTAEDPVSREAFDLLAAKATGGPGSLADAVAGALNHVEDLIKQMEADIAAQVEADDESARRLARS